MSAQNDIIAGKDLSALSSITQEDLMQAINQAVPLDNIGFVIVSTTRPDITNNPRLIRYIWLDISNPVNPSFKRYIGDRTTLQDADAYWVTLGVTDLAVLTSMMAARSATGGINVGLLKLNSDYSASPASAGYILRVAANGKDIEVVAVNTAVSGLAYTSLDTTGLGTGKFLGFNGGVWGAVPIVPSTDLIGAAKIAAETNILGGTDRFVLRTVGASPLWTTPNDIFNNSELAVAKLLAAGAVTNDILRYDGAIWAKVTPSLRLVAGDTANSGIISGSTVATQVHTIPHLLGSIPKLVDVRIRMTNAAADIGYNQNDEVSALALRATTGNQMTAWCADATNITVLFGATTGELPDKGTGALSGINEAKWFPVIYAWK